MREIRDSRCSAIVSSASRSSANWIQSIRLRPMRYGCTVRVGSPSTAPMPS